MKWTSFNKIIIIFLLILPMQILADAPVWEIIPNESVLTFTATQNGTPVTVEFKKFTGKINFDIQKLDTCVVHIDVDMNSMVSHYDRLTETLKNSDWFDTHKYPQATFKSKTFTKTGEDTYQSKGTLLIRDKTIPVTLNFTKEEYSDNRARFKGNTTIQRTAFGVGQGEWADTNTVKDDVLIDFIITAKKSVV